MRVSEKYFLRGLFLILVFMLIHDWVPLGSLNDIEAVKVENTADELIKKTVINAGSILIVIIITLLFVGKRYPRWARAWLIIHLLAIMIGAAMAWWVPYFYGASDELITQYQVMFGNTHMFLPERNGITPNTIHVVFHSILLLTWLLAIYISLTKPKKPNKRHTYRY